MTNEQAQVIATAAIRLHDATRDLQRLDGSDSKQHVREQRRKVDAAQHALDSAIDAAVER